MFKSIGSLCVIFVALELSGCATMMSHENQTVHVEAYDMVTHEAIPAVCYIKNAKGLTYIVHPPVNSTVTMPHRYYGKLHIQCFAKGYQQVKIMASSSFNHWALMDVFFWPGAIIDAATGDIEHYPTHFKVMMQMKAQAAVGA